MRCAQVLRRLLQKRRLTGLWTMAGEKLGAITLVCPPERRQHLQVTTFEGNPSVCLQEDSG